MTASNRNKPGLPLDPSPDDIRRAVEGDGVAFARIVERYQKMTYSIAYKVLWDRGEAEDAAQDAFLRCFRALSGFRGECTFSTWMFRLAASAAVDAHRRRSRRIGGYQERREAATYDLDEAATASSLVGALGELPPEYRVPTVLRDVYGLPYQEIAAMVGRPVGTTRVMVHRGRASLRLRLRALGLMPQTQGKDRVV